MSEYGLSAASGLCGKTGAGSGLMVGRPGWVAVVERITTPE